MTTTNDMACARSSRTTVLDDLAREQAILKNANETDMTEADAAEINRSSFRNRGERNTFKNAYCRHAGSMAARAVGDRNR